MADQDTVWVIDSCESKELCARWGPERSTGKGKMLKG